MSNTELDGSFLVTDEQGHISLLVRGEAVPITVWANAVIAGATLLVQADTGHTITREFFEQQCEVSEAKQTYRLPLFIWAQEHQAAMNIAQQASEGQHEAPQVEPSLFVHVHNHGEHSALDGYSQIPAMVTRAKEQGQSHLALTDHGNCAGHPDFAEECEKQGINPIFGMEAYLVDDRFARDGDQYAYWHLVLWAMDDDGLRNLWAMSTESYRDGFYGKPRLDWDTLTRLNAGVMASSACLGGPVLEPYLAGDTHLALRNLSKLNDIFTDRFYLEIHTNHLENQVKGNQWLVQQARTFGIPMLASVDSHYVHSHEKDDHRVWLAMQTGKDVEEKSALFGGDQSYHMLDDLEVMQSLLYLGEDIAMESMSNTITMAKRCTARIRPRVGMPIYSAGVDAVQQDADRMLEMCFNNWTKRTVGKHKPQSDYEERFEREATLLIAKGFPGYFLMNADLVNHAKTNGILVGPGRGSGAGSLVAYLMGITEVDPVENDLLFERFMTEGRTSLPDFDIDYPSTRKQYMIEYAQSRWGKNHVVSVGTTTRIKNKGAFKDTARAIKSRLPEDYFADLERISKIITEHEATTAGLGLSWDELMDSAGKDLAPYKRKMPYLFEMAGKFRGRVKTYSRHAAGLVIDPKCDLEESVPMFLSSDGLSLTTQWDKDDLEKFNYVKFDFLNLRNLDTVQICVDMIKEQTGEVVNVYDWKQEYQEPTVYDQLCAGWTLGVFQLETGLGTRTTKQLKPRTIADLSDVITIGRPGPLRSGLAATYFRRREGKERVHFADPRLAEVLAKTYGTMLYQEDIMAITMILAQYSSNEADEVRRILGKKKPEKVEAEGKKFIPRAVANGTDERVATDLWAQMAEFALYSFNRAHAFSYAMITYWTAWFKIHYPAQFMTACLTSIENDEIPQFISETRRLGYKVLPPDINTSKEGFFYSGTDIRYGFMSLNGVGQVGSDDLISAQPFTDWDDFMKRKGKCDMGQVKILAKIGAFDVLVPNRKALELRLVEEDVKGAERCIFFRDTKEMNEHNLPCNFDWATEPPIIGRSGKPLKKKDPPKRCTIGCRQYVQRDLPSDIDVVPYSDEEIRNREMEALGVYLSSSPFDIIDPQDLAILKTAHDLQVAPKGVYLVAVIINSVRSHKQKDNRVMKFLKVGTPGGDMDLVAFAPVADQYKAELVPGHMAFAEVKKTDRGLQLNMMESM